MRNLDNEEAFSWYSSSCDDEAYQSEMKITDNKKWKGYHNSNKLRILRTPEMICEHSKTLYSLINYDDTCVDSR